MEYNADTAKVLFDHTSEAEPGVISPAAAIRWLFATQTFAVSTGKSEISHTGTAPSAASVIAIPIGSSLQDTLLFCLIPQNRMVMSSDVPFWERPPETLEYLKTKAKVIDQKSGELKDRTVERRASGLVDLYTWRTRSVIFKERKSGDISHLGFASGVGYQESLDCDPMLAYVIKDVPIKGSKEKTKRKFSVQLEGRELWREFDSLLPDDQQLAPKVIEHAVLLTRSERDRYPKGIMVVGQKYFPPRPNVAFWRKEHFVFPYVFSVSRSIRHEIREILISAEKSGWALNAACESYATDVLTHGERKVERKDIRNFVQQMLPVAFYWPFLEFRFHQILREYTLNHDFDDFDDIRCQWLKAVRNALHQAWEQHKTSVSMGDAWAIRALVKAEAAVLNKRRELDAEILKYEPMKETT